MFKGSEQAKVAIIVYSDFECPYCGVFARDTWPQLEKDYVSTGKVLVAFRHLPLESIHPSAVRAGEAAECAGAQGKFWEMHDELFKTQKQLDGQSLRAVAARLQLDLPTYDKCMEGDKRSKVLTDATRASSLRITGTPTFLIGRIGPDKAVKVSARVSGAASIDRFRQELDPLLK